MDQVTFLRWFEQICSIVGCIGLQKEAIKLILFPFALGGQIREWLETLPLDTITSWEEFVQWFLQCMIPKPVVLKTYEELLHFKQCPIETIGQAWDRFMISLRKGFGGGIHTTTKLQHFMLG